MKKAEPWLRVGLFLVIVGGIFVFKILPLLSNTAPGGPKLSFGGTETCRLGDALEDFNAAGFYMGNNTQSHTYTGHTTQSDLAVYLSQDREQSCGRGQLVNKSDGYLSGSECMVYSFSLRYEDGGRMTCNGVETLGSTQEAIRAGLGAPLPYGDSCDQYVYKKGGRTYAFYFYYDGSGVCTSVSAYQEDPQLSFYSF